MVASRRVDGESLSSPAHDGRGARGVVRWVAGIVRVAQVPLVCLGIELGAAAASQGQDASGRDVEAGEQAEASPRSSTMMPVGAAASDEAASERRGLLETRSADAVATESSASSSRRAGRQPRGLVFGVAAAHTVSATPLANVEGPDQPPLAPGFAVLGRLGVELVSGVSVALLAGSGAMASSEGPSPLVLRALAEVRVSMDFDALRPFASAGAGFLVLRGGPTFRSTFAAEASVGIAVPVAPWAALETSVGAELAVPGDALREVLVLALLPRLGVEFSY